MRYVKRNCLACQRSQTLEAAQQHRKWSLPDVRNSRVHETAQQCQVDRLEAERVHLRPLPGSKFYDRPQLGCRVCLDFTMPWKDNFYEMPYQYAGRRVISQEVGDQLSIMLAGQELALLLPFVNQSQFSIQSPGAEAVAKATILASKRSWNLRVLTGSPA